MLSPELQEVAGHESRAKSERARGFNEKNGKVTTGTPATVQGLERRLRTLFIAALIRDPRLDTGAQILQQRERIGRIAAHEPSRPFTEPPGWIVMLLHGQRAKVRPLVIGVEKRIGDRRCRHLENRPGMSTKFE